MTFDPKRLDTFLVCPKTKSALVRDGDALICVAPECRLKYEIRDDIPNMLIEEAKELTPEDWKAAMQRHGRDGQTGVAVPASGGAS